MTAVAEEMRLGLSRETRRRVTTERLTRARRAPVRGPKVSTRPGPLRLSEEALAALPLPLERHLRPLLAAGRSAWLIPARGRLTVEVR